jgi:hypothetical protein
MQKMPHLERQKNYVRILIQQALKIVQLYLVERMEIVVA